MLCWVARPEYMLVVDRRGAIAALLPIACATCGAQAQPAPKRRRIGFLGTSSPTEYAPNLTAFLQGLREHGYEAGKNIVIDYRWAEGNQERLPELAAELVRLQPDVIVTHATGVQAAQRATTTIPIVMGVSADPVGLGLIQSLARPGGNTTGVASLLVDLSAKRVDLLKEIHPALKRVAVLSSRTPGAQKAVAETEAAARRLGLQFQAFWIDADPNSLDAALAAIVRYKPDGLIVTPDPLTGKHGVRITTFAVQNRLPSMGGANPFVLDGGLISYGGNFAEGWRAAAKYVDRILEGARPADLPVEQPTSFELIINLKTAKLLGITVPHALLLRANEVIR